MRAVSINIDSLKCDDFAEVGLFTKTVLITDSVKGCVLREVELQAMIDQSNLKLQFRILNSTK